MELSIVIPIYNEEANVNALVERLRQTMEAINIHRFELVFVDDGSKDASLAMIKLQVEQFPFIKYISFSRNFGHQIAAMAGIEKSKGKAVVLIDGDLQDPPELIADLYKKHKEGFDVVYAKRASRAGEGFLKRATAKFFYRLISKITNIDIPLDTGDFRIMTRKVVEVLKQMPEQQKFLRGQVAWVGFKQSHVEFDREERQGGRTNYTFSKMLRFAMDGITSFSDFPLRFATISGFVVSGFSFVLMLYALYARFITKDYEPGWTSLILSVLFIGGIQLISIGIIGEYISRMSENVRNRPLYVIQDSNIENEKDESE